MSEVGTLTWPLAGQSRGRVLVVPLGATEQHGPHLPLDTDTRIAVALGEGLAARRADVNLAPALAYGASGEHADFPGTLSLGTAALQHLLVELVRSATRTWSSVVLLSGHGGNAEAVRSAVRLLREQEHDVRAWSPSFGGDAHAGRTETSLLLHLAPEHVHLERAEPGVLTPVRTLLPELQRVGVRGVAPNGVLGDPHGASAAEGEQLLDEALLALQDWLDRPVPASGVPA